ncbi:MAG: hypothetical protein HOP19_13150 [Acidobacteria bacterium]|nr:hypothetical protein [Acidobacteriota bacterium]
MQGGENALEEVAQRVNVLSEEQRRGGLVMSFLGLGTLYYDPQRLLSLIGRDDMILELIKDSPGYQFFLDMAKQDVYEQAKQDVYEQAKQDVYEQANRDSTIRAIKLLTAQRFPALHLDDKLVAITNAATLDQLLSEVVQFDTAEGLQARIAELTAKKEIPTQ